MYAVQIEVVGTCNLRCPSCPVGNSGEDRRKGSIGGTMPPERFRQALDWVGAGLDRDPADTMVCLYSWGEPFIHPELPALIAEAKGRGYTVGISSNLNRVRDLDGVVAAGVDEIVVSLSGFTQDAYGLSHTGGEVETVKRNMAALAEAIDRNRASVRTLVHYITYRHNLAAGEFAAMARFCEELRFEFEPSLAFFIPVEKMVAMADGHVVPADRAILDRLIVPVEEQLRIAAPETPAATCPLVEERVDIDVDGALKLCCSSYDRRFNVAPGFAGIDMAEALRRRRASNLCRDCSARGIERIFTRADYAAWCAHADRVFRELGAPVRCVGTHLVADDHPTESMLLAIVNDHLNACRYGEAKAAFAALERCLLTKYGEAGRTPEGVAAHLRGGGRRFGRDVPIDPLRVFFAEGLVALLHDGDRAAARAVFAAARDMAVLAGRAGAYGRTARLMAPLIADACAAVAEPPPAEAAGVEMEPPTSGQVVSAAPPSGPRPLLERAFRRLRAALGR